MANRIPVIDFHRHLWSADERYPSIRENLLRLGVVKEAQFERESVDAREERVLREMDDAGIDISVLLLGDYELVVGRSEASISDENAGTMAFADRQPDRIIGFYGVDPRRPDSAALFRRGIEAGARGLKLHPAAGFFPNDRICYPLYELANEHGLPVAIHTGPMAAPLITETAHPMYVDTAAAHFPGVNFVLLHAGQRAWFDVALDMARWKPNLFLEVSSWQGLLRDDERSFVERLSAIRKAVTFDRLLFGTDDPGGSRTLPSREWVGAFLALPETAARYGAEITEADVRTVLGGTAASLLGLDLDTLR